MEHTNCEDSALRYMFNIHCVSIGWYICSMQEIGTGILYTGIADTYAECILNAIDDYNLTKQLQKYEV